MPTSHNYVLLILLGFFCHTFTFCIEVCFVIKGNSLSNEVNTTITVVKFMTMLLRNSLQMESFCNEFCYKWKAFAMNFTTNEELLWWILLQMRQLNDEFYYRRSTFVMNFTTEEAPLWWILLQRKGLCRKFYNIQRDLKLLWWCGKVLYCSNWYNFVVKSMRWKCWKF